MNEPAKPPERRKSASGPRPRRKPKWKVVATVQPQGEEGLRWIQLSYTQDDPIKNWWPFAHGSPA
jgi:hypothetical protein